MKPFYHILLIILIIPAFGRAQGTQDTAVFTLEQCLSYALENSNAVKNAVLDEQIAQSKVRETVGIGLPQIDGSVQILHNQKLPRFFSTKETAFGFSRLPAEEYPNFLPGVPDDAVVSSQNFFQLPSNGSAGINITQLLFNGSYLVGLKASDTYRQLSIKATQQSKQQTVEQVTKAYYSTLINKERMKLFDTNIARVDSLLRTTKALNANGFAEKIDVDRVQVTLNNLVIERNKFQRLQLLSLELLKFQMNYPMKSSLDVTGNISELNSIDIEVLHTINEGWTYKNRIEYSMLETQRDLQHLDTRNKLAGSLPVLAAFANLGYQTQSLDIGGLFKTETNLPADAPSYVGPDKWYAFTTFGLSLNIPIFSSLQRSNRIQQSRLELQKVENNITMLKSSIDLETKQSVINFENALESLKGQQENTQLAENIARVTKIKYEQGVGSNLEVVEAETALREAQINYYNALFDVLIAKVDLDKAYGKLTPPDQTPEEK